MPDMLEQLRVALSDRYLIDREIGSGGMARVLLARDLKHRRQVAIKVLRPEIGDAVASDRFLREIEIAAQLAHPNVLPLHDSGETNGLLYYVMPFVEGESLRDRLNREKQLPLPDALRITTEIADALAYAHEHGVLHRDIKPENILLSAGHAVVADFGIARAVSVAAGDRLTATGIAVGTLQYMSPEQALGHPTTDGRSDIYSLGCVLFEMLAGRPPFVGPTPQSIIAQVITEPSLAITKVRDGVPAGVERMLSTALAKDPADRYATADEFGAAVAEESAALSAATLAGKRLWTPLHLSRSATVAIVAAVIVVLAVGAWVAVRSGFSRGGSATTNRIAVLPFAVHGGPQLAYLGEGVVDLLSRNLEGVDDLHFVDAGTIMSALRGVSASVIDAGTGRGVIRRVGAGAFILGSVNAVGPRMRIQAAIYNADGNESGVRASVDGDTAQVLELVDRLAGELLVNRRPGAAHRLIQTAALTTHSLPALKDFLSAEGQLRRGSLDSAIAGYQRAIAEDSTFALAYYRLAVAAGWHERHTLSSEAVTTGLAIRGRLTARDRRLMVAYAAFRRGAAGEAERQYRAVLEDFPDDLEAEFQLGDVLFQYNPLRGRPRLEGRPMFDRVLALDPGFL